MSRPQVRVVLVTWNCRSDLPACLDSLQRNTDLPGWKLLVIDSKSTDGTREWLSSNAGWADLELLEENLGWVRCLNRALARWPAEYLFFLNPDTVVGQDWLRPLVSALEENPRAAFASPKFHYPDATIHYAGAFIGPSLAISVRGHGEADRGQYDRRGLTSFAHGQCLVRAAVVNEVGSYDEGFGLGYFEEADLQLRALRRGYVSVYVPESTIVHFTSKAFDAHPGGMKEQLLIQNWIRLITLHWPARWLLLRAPLDLTRPVRAILRGKDPRPAWRALAAWARSLPRLLARRRALRKTGRVDWRGLRDAET